MCYNAKTNYFIERCQIVAKVSNCTLCGKEITTGFFSGDSNSLDVGLLSYNITCCDECFANNKSVAKRIKKRFSTKCENLIKSKKVKLSQKELGEMYLSYLREEKEQEEKCEDEILYNVLNFFSFNDNGFFSVREYRNGFFDRDITGKDMVKSIEKSQADTQCCCFDKDDITRIEYAQLGSGDFNGPFQKIYSYAIRLNDEKVMTYKPCITRACAYGNGFMFGYKKSAEKRLLEILNEFKEQIGSELPIVKVKKI